MFVHGNWWVPVVAIMLYGVMIVTLPKYTAKKPVKVERVGGREGKGERREGEMNGIFKKKQKKTRGK